MAQCKKILVFGATGLVGSHILRHLVENMAEFEAVAIFTSQRTLESKGKAIANLKECGVQIVTGDLTNAEDVKKAYEGVDTVISALGRNMIGHQVELIRLADQTSSINRFFPSEYGTDIEYGPQSAGEKPHQKKLVVRAAIRNCKKLDHTFLVTGPYADGDPGLYFSPNYGAQAAGSFDVKSKKAVLLGDGNLKISFTTMNDVGKLLVLALLHPEESRNQALRVNSFTATDTQILEEFERQTGGERWRVSYTAVDEVRRLESDAWATANPLATLFTLRRIWAEGGTLYSQRDNLLINAEDAVDSLAEAVAAAINVQLHGEQEMKRRLV